MLLSLVVLATGTIIVLGAVVYQLLVQQGRLFVRLESLERSLRQQGIFTGSEERHSKGLPRNTVLNDFELPVLSGGTMTLSQWSGRRLLLVFFNPSCEFSRMMLPELVQLPWPTDSNDPMPILISTGHADENRTLVERYGIQQPVLLQESREIADLYRALSTPSAYVVNERGRTESELLIGANAVLAAAHEPELLRTAIDDRSGRAFSPTLENSRLVRDGLRRGVVAPPFCLQQVDGAEISLEHYRGKSVLLIFSDPFCNPCKALASKLEHFHQQSRDLSVLMISRGDVDANLAKIAEFGLTFPVVLQQHWEISRAYGMFATPIAYIVDEAGVLASDVLVGTETIMKAATRYRPGRATHAKVAALEYGRG